MSAPKIIYDTDDRKEIFECSSALQNLAGQAIAALVPQSHLTCSSEGVCTSSKSLPLYGAVYDLCPNQRFRDQGALAFCSGTLISSDRILTAGHCVPSQSMCDDTYIVFNYFYTSNGTLATITRANDVYTCHRYITRMHQNIDWGVIQLDRAVHSSHIPVKTVSSNYRLALHQPLSMIGFPGGIPAKVVTARPTALDDWGFYAHVDAFAGNSGSGLFDRNHRLVGILVRGNADYVRVLDQSCVIVNQVSSSEYSATQFEQICWASLAITTAPICSNSSDCPSNECILESSLQGFCNEPSVVCDDLPCSGIFSNDCCYQGSEDGMFGKCKSCGFSDICEDVSAAYQCRECDSGFELEVVSTTTCTGYCKPKGTVSNDRKPSEETCPDGYPLPDCSLCNGAAKGSDRLHVLLFSMFTTILFSVF